MAEAHRDPKSPDDDRATSQPGGAVGEGTPTEDHKQDTVEQEPPGAGYDSREETEEDGSPSPEAEAGSVEDVGEPR